MRGTTSRRRGRRAGSGAEAGASGGATGSVRWLRGGERGRLGVGDGAVPAGGRLLTLVQAHPAAKVRRRLLAVLAAVRRPLRRYVVLVVAFSATRGRR